MAPACRQLLRRLPAGAALLVPAALMVALTARGGGYFAAASALAATEVLLVIALWLILAPRPLALWSRSLSLAVGALAALAGWTALSASWSVSPELALPDAVRVILYAAVLVLGALVAGDGRALRFMTAASTLVLVAICVVAVASRTLPDVVSAGSGRLAHPLSYANALGFAAAAALVLLVHFASAAPARLMRLAAAAAIPAVAATLVGTRSAGAAAVAVAGLAVYAVCVRSAGTVRVLVAAALPCGLAIWALQSAPGADAARPASSSLAAAHWAGLALLCCAIGAAVLVAVTQRRGARIGLSTRVRRTLVVVALCAALPLGVAGAGAGIRLDYWSVAAGMTRAEPLRGEGAGGFALIWPRERDTRAEARDAHSLYLETVAELGVVGLALLGLALGTMLHGLARRSRSPGRERELYCALLATFVAWTLHAGIDWLWEQPAVGLWVFAAAGAALARTPAAPPAADATPVRAASRRARVVRVAAIAGCALIAVATGRLALAASDYEAALRAARTGHCGEARERARESLRVRPTADAHLVLAACAIRSDPAAALVAVDRALQRDPLSWRVHYDRAVALASLGRDPRPEAGAAHGLNLLEGNTLLALERFGASDPEGWRRQAARARFELP